jgi:FkbM family methyltransferase
MTNSTRVLIVAPWGERAGGAEQMLWTILRNLDRSVIEPEVGFLSDGPFVAEVAALGIDTWVVPAGRLRNPIAYVRTVLRLGRRIRRSNASVVVAWSAKTQIYLGVARLLLTREHRGIWWQHAIPTGHWIDRLATLAPTDAVGCSSSACATSQARMRPRRRTYVAYPGVDAGEEPEDGRALRAELGIRSDSWVIGVVGRLQPWKRQDRVIRAVAQLRARNVPAVGLVVGGSAFGLSQSYPSDLQELAVDLRVAEHTVFTGQVDDPSAFYAAMDVFVNATESEPFGIALVEAMAAGLPVVAFAKGGPAEIVRDDVSGRLVSTDEELVDVLASLASNPDLAHQLGKAATSRAREFGGRRSAEAFAGIVDKLDRRAVTEPTDVGLRPAMPSSLAIPVARLTRLAVVHVPPRRRGLRLAAVTERWFGHPPTPLRGRHVSGYSITCDVRDPVQRSLFYRGTYEPRTSALITATLSPGDTFLDVGANVGHYTFLAARIVGPNGAVHAVEASPSAAAALHRDVERNGLGSIVTVHAVAAGESSGRMTLHESIGKFDVGTRHLDVSGNPDTGETVDVVALDELLTDVVPAVVKIDTEGADLRVLSGMYRLLKSARPRLVVTEADDTLLARFSDSVEAIKNFMRSLGYIGRPIVEEWHPPGLAFVPAQESRPVK